MTLPLIFLIAYFILILGISRFFARPIQNLTDFFLAGRSLGAWPVALTFVASWFGAASTLGSINAFHDEGLSGAWQIVIPSVLCFIIITAFMAKPIARQKHLSQPEAVESHYGRAGRLLLALVILASVTVLIGSQLVVAGKFFRTVFGLDIQMATLLSTAAVVCYAMLGGYFAVVVTDIAQVILIALGFTLLCVFTVTQAIPDAAAWQAFLSQQPPHFWDISHQWPHHLFLTLTFVLAWSIAPEMWQRMSSTRSPELAFKAGQNATMVMLLLFVLVITIGLFSTQLVGKDDTVLITLALQIPNPFISSLVLIGFLSAITSTMDSSINVGSLTLTRDIYQGFLRPQASNAELLWASRIATILIVLPAIAVALYYQDLIKTLWISADIYASCMFFPVVGMLFLRQPGRWSGVFAMIFGGIIVTISALTQNQLIPNPMNWPDWPYSTLLGIGFSGIGFGFGYWLSRRQGQATQQKTPQLPSERMQTSLPDVS